MNYQYYISCVVHILRNNGNLKDKMRDKNGSGKRKGGTSFYVAKNYKL